MIKTFVTANSAPLAVAQITAQPMPPPASTPSNINDVISAVQHVAQQLGAVVLQPTSTTIANFNSPVPAAPPPPPKGSTAPAQSQYIATPKKTYYVAPIIKPYPVGPPSSVLEGLSLRDIANLILDPRAHVTTSQSKISKIIPNFQTHNDPGRSLPRASDKLAVTSKKFSPYEQLTGISQDRPEIVMATDFLPLYQISTPSNVGDNWRYDNNPNKPSLTTAGMFFEHQLSVRSLHTFNMKQLISTLKERYNEFRKFTADRKQTFYDHISELNSTYHFLWGLVKLLETTKDQFDLRNVLHNCDPQNEWKRYALNFSNISTDLAVQSLTTSFESTMPNVYNIESCLTEFGYATENVKNVYTSTKIWLQLLLEFKHLLATHSSKLLGDTYQQSKDDSPIKILQIDTIKRFAYTSWLPTLPDLNHLKDIEPSEIPQVLNDMSSAYDKIYESIWFNSFDQRIACLINLISKEYRYSYGLSKPDVKLALSTYYNYQENSQDNFAVFDAIVGQFGNNISDLPAIKNNSLTSVAWQQPEANVAVLPLESRYIEGDTGTLTPGSEYYVDPILFTDGESFNDSRLNDLRNRLIQTHKQFGVIVNGMNLMSVDKVEQSNHTSVAGNYIFALQNPLSLIKELKKSLLSSDGSGLNHDYLNDPLTAVFAYANNDVKVRSLLTMYFITRLSRSYFTSAAFFTSDISRDNTPTTAVLAETIIAELLKQPSVSTGIVNKIINVAIQKGLTAAAKSNVTNTTIPAAPTTFNSNSTPTSFYTKSPASPSTYDVGNSQSNTTNQQTTVESFVTVDSIRSSLKTMSPLMKAIETVIGKMIASFKDQGKVLDGNRTRYGGHLDTVIVMSIVDVITSIISAYGNRKFIGTYINKNIENLVIDNSWSGSRNISNTEQLLRNEAGLTQRVILALLNTMNKFINTTGNVSSYLQSPETKKQMQKIVSMFDDPNTLHMLFSEQQIKIFASSVTDLTNALQNQSSTGQSADEINSDGQYDSDDELCVLDDAELGPKMRFAMESLFSQPEFAKTQAASHKIMTVGIPLGFTKHLQQKIDIKNVKNSSFDNKENDIINIVFYKVDLQNPDIIYKPQKFIFEMSRFPVRNDWRVQDSNKRSSVLDIVRTIPTRNVSAYSSSMYGLTDEYFELTDANQNLTLALTGETYTFLTPKQKRDLYTNHAISYMLELYVKIMTGNSIADHNFDMIEPQPLLESEYVGDVVNRSINVTLDAKKNSQSTNSVSNEGVFFPQASLNKYSTLNTIADSNASRKGYTNAAGISGVTPHSALTRYSSDGSVIIDDAFIELQTTDAALSNLVSKDVTAAAHSLGVINEFSRMMTPQSDPLSVAKKLLQPKQFDRVFNVLLDPNSFEIDLQKTNSTPHGKQALELAVKKGDIIPVIVQTASQLNINTNKFVVRDRDFTEGDITFEKYFVNIETIGEGIV